jgi:hypothetical protein
VDPNKRVGGTVERTTNPASWFSSDPNILLEGSLEDESTECFAIYSQVMKCMQLMIYGEISGEISGYIQG